MDREARLRLHDFPWLLTMALFGAIIGPMVLAWGLQRTSGTGASLMLTLSVLFTVVFVWRFYGETMDRRVLGAVLLLLAGGLSLILDRSRDVTSQFLGLIAMN